MRPWLKRTLQITGSVVLLLAACFGALLYSVVGGNTEITDGATPAPGVRIIKDGFVDFGVVDVGEGHVVLIDAGNDPKGAALLAELARRKVGPDAVTAIFFTRGSAAYLVSGVLFLGDSAGMKTDGKLAPPPWAFSDDLAKSRASLVALGKMLESEKAAVVAIVPSHTGTGKFEDLTAFTPRP